jgi:Glycine rich protein
MRQASTALPPRHLHRFRRRAGWVRSTGLAITAPVILAAGLALVAAPSADAAVPHTVTFATPGGPYLFTVPAGVTSLTVHAIGGAGSASGTRDAGGAGADVQAELAVTPGTVFDVHVAGNGVYGPGGANGGGTSPREGGGGGASDVRTGTDALAGRVIVAAGGGGGGAFAAGGAAGQAGADGFTNCPETHTVAQPGTLLAGGAGGSGACGYAGGTDGSLGAGGTGGDNPDGGGSGGGGGGGYYGGGGGSAYGGGAGGSSFTASSATNVATTLASNTAAPSVQISYTTPQTVNTYSVDGTATRSGGIPSPFGPGSLTATVDGSGFTDGALSLPPMSYTGYRLFGVLPTTVTAHVTPASSVTGAATADGTTVTSSVNLVIDQVTVGTFPLLAPGSKCQTVAPSTVTLHGPAGVLQNGGVLNGGTYTAANFTGCGLFGFFLEPLLNANLSGIPAAINATLGAPTTATTG